MTPEPMDRDEYRRQLEAVARASSSDGARVSAIRQLREMDEEDSTRDPETETGSFDDLDQPNVARIHRK